MKDHRHRNYELIIEVSKKTQNASDLFDEIKYFIQSTKLNHNDWIVLTVLLKNLEKQINPSNKVLRSIRNKFETIKQHQR